MSKGTIETTFGLKPRYDIVGEDERARRGWKGVAMGEAEDAQNRSKESAASI
jgi:hypothetical protein